MLLLMVFTISSTAMAQPQLPLTVKQRLRILLWTEGLKEEVKAKSSEESSARIYLPEEIERPLRNL